MKLMRTSKAGIDLIKTYEGCKLSAYKPVSTEKYYTIGYGHYGADVNKDMTITQTKAEELLVHDVIVIERNLNEMSINFTQNAFDALVSWIYNLGLGNFKSSTMYKYIVAKRSDIEITDQMVKWVNAGGKPLLGLKKRRCAEANMWLGKDLYHVSQNGTIYKS
jgi:GH24 family phage-related lysozyme (muramidase)